MTKRQAISWFASVLNQLNSSLVLPYDLQRIADHWGIGRIVHQRRVGNTYVLITTKDHFLIVYHPYPQQLHNARENPQLTADNLAKTWGPVQRLLRPDYRGHLNPETSFVHQRLKYYSAWKLLK